MESSPHLDRVTFQEKLSEEIHAEINYIKHNREARKANKELMDNFIQGGIPISSKSVWMHMGSCFLKLPKKISFNLVIENGRVLDREISDHSKLLSQKCESLLASQPNPEMLDSKVLDCLYEHSIGKRQ